MTMRLARQGTVLLLVDLQEAFCGPHGSMAQQGRDIAAMRAAMQAARRLADGVRGFGVPVAWTRLAFAPDYADGGRLVHDLRPNLKAIGALRRGSADVELAAGCGYREGDELIDKNRYSAVLGTSLERWLARHRAQGVLVGGVTTSMCVDTTVRELSQRDFATFVVREACGDFDAARHEAALAAMAFGFARVIGLDEALAALGSGGKDF